MKAQKRGTTKKGKESLLNKASVQRKPSLLDKEATPNFLESVYAFFERNEKKMFFLIIVAGTLMSLLLFDVKVSLSGDDCDYIVAAGDFWKHFTFPGHHGPLYPIILSPFVGIFGVKLIMLKLLSTVFLVASLWLFYKSFQRIVPAIVTIPALFLVSINPYVFFFASYTYSEPLFMFMQALFFYLFSTYFWRNDTQYTLRNDWGKYLSIAIVIIGTGLTRTVGFCTIGVVMLFFIMERRWKDLFYTTSIFFILFGVFYVSKPIIWPESASVQSFETLFAKNPYNPIQGAEDISGLIARVTQNSHIYLSGFLYKYFGFRDSSDWPLEDIPLLSLLTYILFFICLAAVFKKNKFLTFTGLYAGAMLVANFVLLHILWAQDRFIMVYYPFILLFLFGGLYYFFTKKKFIKIAFVFPVFMGAILIGTGIHAKNRIGRNIPVLQQNLMGNDLYGLTPDWENFVKMSRWANEKLDKTAVIASRKPSISFVYTGREFFGIYNVPYVDVNEITHSKTNDKGDYLYLTVELGSNQNLLSGLAPFLQYIFVTRQEGSFSIKNQVIQSAVVYKIDKDLFSREVTDYLDENNIIYTLDYDSFLKQYVDDNTVSYQIIDPDVLLEHLKINNVKYLILAKIRLYTPQNTGYYINTIHQLITYIQLKYGDLFTLIHTIGKDETCDLAEFTGL